MKHIILIITAILFGFVVSAQNDNKGTEQKINYTDAKGRKQGLWMKKFPNGKLAYKITFKNDKPVGEFLRYHENGNLNVKMHYNDNGTYASAELFNENGELEAKGYYEGKEKDSVWTYYKSGKLPIREVRFNNGKKHGTERTFFYDGTIAQIRYFDNGIENGSWKVYYPDGTQKSESRVENGELNGYYYLFDRDGSLLIRGNYKNNIKDGQWTYNFRQKKVINYINGEAENSDELDSIKTLQHDYMIKNKDKYVDPEQFRNNPDEYMYQMRRKRY